MAREDQDYPTLLKTVRDQLGLSQEDLARELGVSFATVNRWENGQAKPSKLAKVQLEAFCEKLAGDGTLDLSEFEAMGKGARRVKDRKRKSKR